MKQLIIISLAFAGFIAFSETSWTFKNEASAPYNLAFCLADGETLKRCREYASDPYDH